MNVIRLLFMVVMLVTPMSNSSVIFFSDDDQVCELLENIGEEEEDDKEEDFEEETYLKEVSINASANVIREALSSAAYQDNHSSLTHLLREVQTPPPEV